MICMCKHIEIAVTLPNQETHIRKPISILVEQQV